MLIKLVIVGWFNVKEKIPLKIIVQDGIWLTILSQRE